MIYVILVWKFPIFAQINESDTLTFQTKNTIISSWQSGNVDLLAIRAKLDLSASVKKKWVCKSQNSFLYQEIFKRKADEDVFSRNFLYYNPHQIFYPFVMGFISTNFRREIDMRYFTGIGITWQGIKSKNHTLKFAISGIYEETRFKNYVFNSDFYTQNNSNIIATTRATAWIFGKHFVFDKKIIVHYDGYVQPSFERSENIRWQIDAGADFILPKNFSIVANILYTYESAIAISQKQEDTIVTFGFSYALKK